MEERRKAAYRPPNITPKIYDVGGLEIEVYEGLDGFSWCRAGDHCNALTGPFRSRDLALADARVMLGVTSNRKSGADPSVAF
jgi:hypothetical protein